MAQIPPRQPWSRRKQAMYWLVAVAVLVVGSVLSYALDANNHALAGAVVAVTTVILAIWFVVVVIRLLRDG